MKEDPYLELLKENTYIQEAIPWRSGKVPIEKGKTALDGLRQDCLVLNDLKFVLTWKPSFMLVVPDMSTLYKAGSGTNGWIITARKAQQLSYQPLERGTCLAKTYFFGRPKMGRLLDWWQRMFERGLSIENISGLKGFPKDCTINVTCSKKDLSKTTLFSGKQITGSAKWVAPVAGMLSDENTVMKVPARFDAEV